MKQNFITIIGSFLLFYIFFICPAAEKKKSLNGQTISCVHIALCCMGVFAFLGNDLGPTWPEAWRKTIVLESLTPVLSPKEKERQKRYQQCFYLGSLPEHSFDTTMPGN